MTQIPHRTHTIDVMPCARDPRSFRWVIRAGDGAVVRRSPYAFDTSKGARISGECWRQEHFGAGQA